MYKHYYTPEHTLVLNLDFDIPKNHDARFISRFVDSIPDSEFPKPTRTGRPGHHPRMLLKMLLFAYSRGVYSGRKIAQMNEEMIPMKWLTQDQYVGYHSINDFRVAPHTRQLIRNAFVYFYSLLKEHHYIDDSAIFIDGTKLEADANRYSFVWRKSVEKHEAKLNREVAALYDELIQHEIEMAIQEDDQPSSEGILAMIQKTEEKIEALNQAIDQEPQAMPGGSVNKRMRRLLKKFSRKLSTDYYPRKKKYEKANQLFNGRNSYSKTDVDATFMCMKEDAMKNRTLKPGYNLQIATHHQFVLAYDLYSNPTDTRTLIPFLMSNEVFKEFACIVADAGYGSESNYQYIIEEMDKVPLIPYSMYRKEQTKKYKNDPKQRHNWTYYEELDAYVDDLGVQFSFSHYSTKKDPSGFERAFKVYKADKIQSNPELDKLALTPSGKQRAISVNHVWEYYKNKAKEHLESDSGSQIYAQRKIDVEPVFGQMKRNFGMRRVHVRGSIGVSNDVGILLLAMNLTRLAQLIRGGHAFFIKIIYLSIKKMKIEEHSNFLKCSSTIF